MNSDMALDFVFFYVRLGFVLIRNHIGDTVMDYTLGIGILAVGIIYGGFYLIRKRVKRRNDMQADIPVFLRGGDKPIDDSLGGGEINGREIPMIARKG